MTKILMLMILAVIVTGCAPLTPKDCHKNSAINSCTYNRSGKVSDKDLFGYQALGIKKALDAALIEPHAWGGKRCDAHLDFKIDGTLQNFIIKSGDEGYCHALVEASKRTLFPPFTDQHVYDVMGSSRWDFHGQP